MAVAQKFLFRKRSTQRQHSSSLGQAAAQQQQWVEKLPAHLPAPEINSAPGLDEPYLTQRLCETSLLASHCWPAWKTEVGSAECCTFFTNTGNSSQQAPTVISRAEPPPQPQDEQGERSQTGIYHFIPSGGAWWVLISTTTHRDLVSLKENTKPKLCTLLRCV